ncbi:MAG: IS66 family transposase [Deltaproteobacteria bacterium]|nr:MAG: IS66 family transposase [Deltaproteobacteria bacterium]
MIFETLNAPEALLSLQQENAFLLEKIAQKERFYESEIKLLKQQILSLQQMLFGRKSEKLPIDQQQLPLFKEPEQETAADDASEAVHVPAHTRRKSGRKPLPENLPRIEVIHDLSEKEKQCSCGCMKTRIGEEISEQLDIIPARMQVIRHIRYKYVCRACEGTHADESAVSIAPAPLQMIPKSMASPGLLAHVFTGKFVDALPFYRQEKQFLRLGVELKRATMCNWAMQVADKCALLLKILHKEILSGPLINADETTLKVLKEPNKSKNSKSYMWVFRGGPPDRPCLIYHYNAGRSGDVASSFLGDYKGCVQTDGYAGYDFLDVKEDITHIGCWAHARRKFVEVERIGGKRGPGKKKTNAKIALDYIGSLYKIEKQARDQGLCVDEIRALRAKEAKPILNEFKKWLDEKSIHTPPKGVFGKAITYTLNQWDRLKAYTEYGFATPDNNAAENAIRPFVVGRKNWLFSGHPAGARASAVFYSLIETAKANGLEPYQYLRTLFEQLPKAKSTKDYQALLPQHINLND